MVLEYGDLIDLSLFEDDLINIAISLKDKGKSVFELSSLERDTKKYIFINIYQLHASIIVVDAEVFDRVFYEPSFGHLIENVNLDSQEFNQIKRFLSIPLQQYHITLDDKNSRYLLTRNLFYFRWFVKSHNFYIGNSNMSYFGLQLLSLMVVPSKYRLIIDDCLEFSKRYAREIATKENGFRKTEIEAIIQTLRVSNNYITGGIELKSRRNPSSGFSAAFSYFLSFKPWRFFLFIFISILLWFFLSQYYSNFLNLISL